MRLFKKSGANLKDRASSNYEQMDAEERQRFDTRVADVKERVDAYKQRPDIFKRDYIRGKQALAFGYALDPKTAFKSLTAEYVSNLMSTTSSAELKSMASEVMRNPDDISKREALFGALERAQVDEVGYDPQNREMMEKLDLLEHSHQSVDQLSRMLGANEAESIEMHKKIDAQKEAILQERELRVPTLKYPYTNQIHAFMDKIHVDELKKATNALPESLINDLGLQLKENRRNYNQADQERVDVENSIRLISSLADPDRLDKFMQRQRGESEMGHLQRINNLYRATNIIEKSANNLVAKYDLYIESEPDLAAAFKDLKQNVHSVRDGIESASISKNNRDIINGQSKKEIKEEKLNPEHADYDREVNFSYRMMDVIPRSSGAAFIKDSFMAIPKVAYACAAYVATAVPGAQSMYNAVSSYFTGEGEKQTDSLGQKQVMDSHNSTPVVDQKVLDEAKNAALGHVGARQESLSATSVKAPKTESSIIR